MSVISRELLLEKGPWLRRIILAGSVIAIPSVFFRSANDPFNTPKLALLVSVVAVVGAIRTVELLQGSERLGLKIIWIPAVAMSFPLFLAWAFSPYRSFSLFGVYGRWQGLIPYVLVVLFSVLLADAFRGYAEDLAWAFVISGGVVGGYAVIQAIGLDPFEWAQVGGGATNRTSTLGNSNFFGAYLAFTLPVAVALFLHSPKRRPSVSKIGALLVGGLILSFSQNAWASAIVGGLVFAGHYFSTTSKRTMVAGWIAAGVTTGTLVGLVVLSNLAPGVSPLEESARLRGLWWEGAVSMWRDSPVIGRGPNTYAIEGALYRPPEDAIFHAFDFTDDPHSVPLSILTGAGLVGLFGFGVVGSWVVMNTMQHGSKNVLVLGFGTGAVVNLVESLSGIDELSLRVAFWVCIAGIASALSEQATKQVSRARQRGKRGSKTTPVRNPFGLAISGVIAVALLYWALRFVVADVQVRQGFLDFRRKDVAQAQREFNSALRFREDYQTRHFFAFNLGQAALRAGDDGTPLFEDAIEQYGFTESFPRITVLTDKAAFLESFSEFDSSLIEQAAVAYSRAIEADPYNLGLIFRALPTITDSDRFDLLAQILETRVDEFAPVQPGIWAVYGLAELAVGKTEEAQQAAQQAEQLLPGDPLTKELLKRLSAQEAGV